MSVLQSRTTILAALKTLIENISAVGTVFDSPMTSSELSASDYPAVDLQWAGVTSIIPRRCNPDRPSSAK